MDVWEARSRWNTIVKHLDVNDVSKLTGLKPDTIRHYLSREDSTFPEPYTSNGRIYFTGQQIFRYILDRGKRTEMVPRLFPRTSRPAAAQFMGVQRWTMPDVGHFAIHTWAPSDGAGPIAIAYPDRENTTHVSNAARTAAALYSHLSRTVTAVAVPNGESHPVFHSDSTEVEPVLIVSEQPKAYRHSSSGHGTARYNWTDLVNLLRTDLPWWSPQLNAIEPMLTWRPESPAVRITPYSPRCDTSHLAALSKPTDPPAVREAIDLLIKQVLIDLAGRPYDGHRVCPGLVQAAINTFDVAEPVPTLCEDQVAAVLHHRTDAHTAKHALRLINRFTLMPILNHGISFDLQTAGPMARQWFTRLADVSVDRRNELGFAFVSGYYEGCARPVRWLTDPDATHSWVIQGDNGTIYVGVGTSCPDATGELLDAEIGSNAVFFRDSVLKVWPVPGTGYSYYRTGYEGAGPQRLVETLTTLRSDAAADVHRPTTFSADTRLYDLLTSREAPLTLTDDFLRGGLEPAPSAR